MKRLLTFVLFAAGISMFVFACSDKSSQEACRHETTHNLDKGNYDAVLASGCAGDMQKGAAYMGKAGFKIQGVINSFIGQGEASSQTSTTNKGDLSVYMNSLIGQVTSTSLAYLEESHSAFDRVCDATPQTEPLWKDANFNESLINSLKTLSLLKTVIDSSGTGTVSACDVNGNKVPDEADATACALIASSNISEGTTTTCRGSSWVQLTPVDMPLFYDSARQNPVEGTYSGLVVTIAAAGAPAAGCPTTFNKLLYKNADSGMHWVATTVDTCFDSAGHEWPCPLVGPNVDLVATLDTSLDAAQTSLQNATPDAKGSDAIKALQKIRSDACPTGKCTNESISNYLQTMKK